MSFSRSPRLVPRVPMPTQCAIFYPKEAVRFWGVRPPQRILPGVCPVPHAVATFRRTLGELQLASSPGATGAALASRLTPDSLKSVGQIHQHSLNGENHSFLEGLYDAGKPFHQNAYVMESCPSFGVLYIWNGAIGE